MNPAFPPLGEIPAAVEGPGLTELEGRLVDGRTGVVRGLATYRKAPREPEWPRIVRAELSNFRYRRDKADAFQVASGKGMDAETARVSALGEAVERYSGGIWSDEAVERTTRAGLAGEGLDPRELVLYPQASYAGLPYVPYEEGVVLGWVWGRDLCRNVPLALPAQPTLMAHTVQDGEAPLCQATSNGLAAGRSLADAALRAAYEVIERDAMIATWLLRLPAVRIDIASLGDRAITGLYAAYRRRGVALELYRMAGTTAVHAFCGLGVATEAAALPAVVVGLGADHDARRAARSALVEVGQVRPWLKYRLNDPQVIERRARMREDPERVEALEDHDLYYSGFETLGAFDFLRGGPAVSIAEFAAQKDELHGTVPGLQVGERLRSLVAELAATRHRLCVADLTPPDMASLGLHTARAFITGYQPIYFGQKEMRVATDRLDDYAQRLLGRPFTAGMLNPDPHPIA